MEVEKCLNCQGEVKNGYIQSGTRLAWVPKVAKLSVEPSLNKGSVILSKQNRFKINFIDASICVNCRRVTINY